MRSIVAAAVLAMAALPASAQQSGTQPPQSGAQQQSSAQSGVKSTAAQTQLRQSLEQAGFKNVKIVDAAYMVRARTADGNMAVMYIDPPAVGSGTTGSGASGPPKAMTAVQLRTSLEKAGFKEVKVVDSAYLVNAQTNDGGHATMYIDPSADAARAPKQGGGSGASGASKSSK